jgi:N-acyl-D-aspartate/D-glutamate deacylase
VENERLRDRLRSTHEELAKCKDQLDNAFQVVSPGFTTVRTHTRNALNKSCNIIGKKITFK